MERRRAFGLALMGIGVIFGVLGKAFSSWPLGLVASLGLVVGGALIALSYREESGRPAGGSRASLVASSAALKLSSGRSTSGPSESALALTAYVEHFRRELDRCEGLLDDGGAPAELEAARERLVVLVASPRYGEAIRRRLVDETKVTALSSRLAAELGG